MLNGPASVQRLATATAGQRLAQISLLVQRPVPRSIGRDFSAATTLKKEREMAEMDLFEDGTPKEVRDAKGLHLITMSTPNGQKVQIMMEELADLYGTTFTKTMINIGTNEQKKDWFLRLNPNGRIPVLLDATKKVSPEPFPVFETSAILLYLLEHFDTKREFGFNDPLQTSDALQWLCFYYSGGAPYQGQVNHFLHAAPEKIPYAINRYKNEVLRVFGVLEIRLSGKYTGSPREYLAGNGTGKYSVADIGTWAWVKGWKKAEFTDEEMASFPHLKKWIDKIAARPAVQRGIGEKYSL